jgi:hypothetical protein
MLCSAALSHCQTTSNKNGSRATLAHLKHLVLHLRCSPSGYQCSAQPQLTRQGHHGASSGTGARVGWPAGSPAKAGARWLPDGDQASNAVNSPKSKRRGGTWPACTLARERQTPRPSNTRGQASGQSTSALNTTQYAGHPTPHRPRHQSSSSNMGRRRWIVILLDLLACSLSCSSMPLNRSSVTCGGPSGG